MTPPRRGGRKSLYRRRPHLAERRRFVVYCEGEVTEPRYLQAFARLPEVRTTAVLDIRGEGCGPMQLVDKLIKHRRKDHQQRGSRERADTEYWCVFDVEAPQPHPRLIEAVRKAEDSRISVAVSNPCFELWLILHFAEHTSWLDTRQSQAIRRGYDGATRKELHADAYMERRTDAIGRARKLAEMHSQAERHPPHDNPSSDMFRLLEAVNSR